MCGIVGIIRFDGQQISEKELKVFTNSLHHRGPDGSNIFLDKEKKIGFGHTRTVTFDTSKNGLQPMSYLDGRYHITFNGDILNFIEIREELKSLGYKFKSDTDTEVLLAAYANWGEECQFKFNGDWAFAIWDEYKKKLFISRDRFGEKPLYYIHNSKYFIFASELKAFMSLNNSFRPDFDYGFLLWLGYNYGSLNSFLKDVLLLQPGYQININNNKVKKKKWWSTIDHLVKVPIKYEDQVEQFKELFFDSCKLRLRSDVPIGASLSGGMDSSAVCSVMEQIRKNPLNLQRNSDKNFNVFICEFSGDKNSEKKFAEDVVKDKKIVPNYFNFQSSSITPEELNKVQFENEWIDPDSIPVSMMYKKMRSMGIRICLDGAGPDDTLGGLWEDPYFAMIDEVRLFYNSERFNDLMGIKNEMNNKTDKSKYKFLLRKLIGPNNFSKLTTIFNTIKNGNIYNYDKYNLINKSQNIYPEEDDIKKLNHFDKRAYKQFHYYNNPYNLLKGDKLSMSHGVAARSPFMDTNLVKYIFSLPSSAKLGNGFTKRILRDSMKNFVPRSVISRKDKRGFSSPPNWYGENMNNYILDNLNSSDFLNSNIFDGKKIKKDYEKNSKFISSKIVLKYVQILNLIKSFKEIQN
jgi:asparagine synthase (glutamine-hydrolysing)